MHTNPDHFNPDQFNPDQFTPIQVNSTQTNPDQSNPTQSRIKSIDKMKPDILETLEGGWGEGRGGGRKERGRGRLFLRVLDVGHTMKTKKCHGQAWTKERTSSYQDLLDDKTNRTHTRTKISYSYSGYDRTNEWIVPGIARRMKRGTEIGTKSERNQFGTKPERNHGMKSVRNEISPVRNQFGTKPVNQVGPNSGRNEIGTKSEPDRNDIEAKSTRNRFEYQMKTKTKSNPDLESRPINATISKPTTPLHPSIRPSTHPSIHPRTHPSIHPSIHAPIALSSPRVAWVGRVGSCRSPPCVFV